MLNATNWENCASRAGCHPRRQRCRLWAKDTAARPLASGRRPNPKTVRRSLCPALTLVNLVISYEEYCLLAHKDRAATRSALTLNMSMKERLSIATLVNGRLVLGNP
eukprot:1426647-Amphidinium_carterae.3